MKVNKTLLIVCSIQTIVFIYFLDSGFLGSDWDSYALVGTAKIWIESNIYIPSRPPGFPAYELIMIGSLKLQESLKIPFEKIILSIQYIFLILSNILIFKMFMKTTTKSLILYSVVTLSPIYIISGLSAIDYLLGTLLGFLAIYISISQINNRNSILLVLLFTFSISMRLSNLIFLFAFLVFMFSKKEFVKNTISIFLGTLILTLCFYGYFYFNLWEPLLKDIYGNNLYELLCVFNLTNTEHTLFDRLGRFFLKQTNYISVFGLFILLFNFKSLKEGVKKDNLIYIIIFVSFQLSFLRLPTEEGHLLPAFISFFIILANTQQDLKLKKTLLVLVVLSNLVNFNFYKVDQIDSANSIELNFKFEKGQILEDYQIRKSKGENKLFHYQNSVDTLLVAWKNGCPN